MTTSDPAQVHRDTARQLVTDAGHLALEDAGRLPMLLEAQVHATLAQSEELRTANIVATYDDGMGAKSIAPMVTAGMYDSQARTQQQVREAFKRDQRERIARRTGQV